MTDLRNIEDRYKGWTQDLIREDISKQTLPFAVCMENWQGDFNIGTCIRNANAFGAREVFYVGGKKKIDRRGAVGTYLYTTVKHLAALEDFAALKDKYKFVGIDNIDGSVPMEDFEWPKEPCLMIFGEEGCGLTPEIVALCDCVVKIAMRGTVRSLNAGTASGIACYDYATKIRST